MINNQAKLLKSEFVCAELFLITMSASQIALLSDMPLKHHGTGTISRKIVDFTAGRGRGIQKTHLHLDRHDVRYKKNISTKKSYQAYSQTTELKDAAATAAATATATGLACNFEIKANGILKFIFFIRSQCLICNVE